MSKHTPGPWMIRAERYRFIHVYAHGGGIAHLDTIDGEGSANARIIAAAPDLLEALELIVMERAWYRSERPEGYNIEDRLNAWEETARAAIAKAKGEQQC